MKLVSIVMNCRNGSRFLKSALLSVINQTYENWELVFWDNNSLDNSKKIVNSFKDQRIKYYFSKGEFSLSKNRNDAIMKTKGDYICFLDTDDIWLPNHLEHLMNMLINNCRFAYSDSLLLKDFKKKKIYNNINSFNLKFLNDIDKFALSRNIFFGSIIVEKRLLKSIMPFENNLNHSIDDYIILSLICNEKNNVSNNKMTSFIYRIHSSNLTNFQKNLSAKEAINVLYLIEIKQKVKFNNIVFKERFYKNNILSFFDKNFILKIHSILKNNLFYFLYFLLNTIFKKIKRNFSKVKNQKEIIDYIEKLEV